MGLFEFFFPEWAAAEHLRTLAESKRREFRARHRRRFPRPEKRAGLVERGDPERRIEALEEDLGFLSLLLFGILEELQEKGTVAREDVIARMAELDTLDGVRDGRLNVQVLRRLYEKGSEGGDPER